MLPLNDIEHEIIGLVCKGKTTEEVGQILGKSKGTVQGHLRVIYPKLDAKNLAEACAHFAALQSKD